MLTSVDSMKIEQESREALTVLKDVMLPVCTISNKKFPDMVQQHLSERR